MLSVNFQPPQIKADAKPESGLLNVGRKSGRAGTFLQFLRPKNDPKSRQVATDAQLVSGTKGTAKAVLNGTEPSRSPVVRSKKGAGKEEAKAAGRVSKDSTVSKKKSNVPEDRGTPVGALGQAQQQIATKISLTGKLRDLKGSGITKVDGLFGSAVDNETTTVNTTSKTGIQSSVTIPIKTAVNSSNNSHVAKNLAQTITDGKNKSAGPRKQASQAIVNISDERGVKNARTVQHKVGQGRANGDTVLSGAATQGATEKTFSLKEDRVIAQPSRRMPLSKVAVDASEPGRVPDQSSYLNGSKKNRHSKQEPEVEKKASGPVVTKRQNSNAVNSPEPHRQARTNELTSETGPKISKDAPVSIAVSREAVRGNPESLLKSTVSQKTKTNLKVYSDRVSTSSIGELNVKSEGPEATKPKALTNTRVTLEGKNSRDKNGIETNQTEPKLSVRHLGLKTTAAHGASGYKKDAIESRLRYQVDGKKQDVLSSEAPSSQKPKMVEASKLDSVLKSITQAANTGSPAKFNNRGLRNQATLIQHKQKVQTPSTDPQLVDGKNLNSKMAQVPNNKLLEPKELKAVLKPKKQYVSIGVPTRATQRGLNQSIINSRKVQITGNVENKVGSGGMEAAFLESEMKLANKLEFSNDAQRQNMPLGESFVSNGAKSHVSMAAEMLEAGRSDLSHIKDIAARNDLANRLNQMEIDLQSVQSKSNQVKGQPVARAIVYREIMSAVETFRGMNSARWAMTIEPFDSLRIKLDLRMLDSQLVVQARLDRGSQALLSGGWSELQASLAEKDVDLKSLITNGQKEGGGTLFNEKNKRQFGGTQRDDESWFSEELGELMAEFEKGARQPRKAKHTNRKARMADATFESWA